MCNIIKTLSNKLNKLELENKNSQKQTQYNKSFNPQYRGQNLQILRRGRKDQYHIQAPLYIEADRVEKQEHPEDQISTLYAIDEDELGIEGEEYEYDETYSIHDENKIDEYWKHFSNFMQAKLHKKYDLRLRKRSRNQENESEQQVSTYSSKATPQEYQSAKQVNKGK